MSKQGSLVGTSWLSGHTHVHWIWQPVAVALEVSVYATGRVYCGCITPVRMAACLIWFLKCWIRLFWDVFSNLLDTLFGAREFSDLLDTLFGAREFSDLLDTLFGAREFSDLLDSGYTVWSKRIPLIQCCWEKSASILCLMVCTNCLRDHLFVFRLVCRVSHWRRLDCSNFDVPHFKTLFMISPTPAPCPPRRSQDSSVSRMFQSKTNRSRAPHLHVWFFLLNL